MTCALIALVWANSPWSESYFSFWETPLDITFGSISIHNSLLHWINDGLMAVLFLLVGLEIKREVMIGELSSVRQATLPVVAAIGGMLVPALIYAVFNFGGAGKNGWGIPMTTDIAFALGVLSLAGKQVSNSLKIFLTAIAISDDIGSVLVIVFFYTSNLFGPYMIGMGILLAILILMNKSGVRSPGVYMILGLILWFCTLKSGIHTTVAGILLAFTIPTRVRLNPMEFASQTQSILDDFSAEGERPMTTDQQAAIHALEKDCERVQMPLQRIEHSLHPWVAFGIMPLFALANSGLVLSSKLPELLQQPVTLGVLLGLLVGKPVGIVLFSWLAIKFKCASLPKSVRWSQIWGIGVLGGIGYTMALFITQLAFTEPALQNSAKMGIVISSVIAGILGWFLVRVKG